MCVCGCVCVCVCGWVSEFWTSGIVYNVDIHYKPVHSVLNSTLPKGGLNEFWNNTFYMQSIRTI